MNSIKGKVAAIIDDYTVILNIGSNENVEEGMVFAIYSVGLEVRDPDTGESLGEFENVKTKVKVKSVAEKYSTAKSFETDTYSTLLTAAIVASQFTKTELKKLPLNENEKNNFFKIETEDAVRVGDKVRQTLS